MSVSSFRNDLRDYVAGWLQKNERRQDDPRSKGMAFEDFVLELLTERFDYEETSPEQNIFRTNDLNFDIVITPDGLFDSFTVCQCEMGNISSRRGRSINHQKCSHWFETFKSLMDDNWLLEQKVEKSFRNLLNDVKAGINDFKSVRWYYASNLERDQRCEASLKVISRHLSDIYPNVDFQILCLDELAALYKENQKVGESTPCDVTFKVAKDKGFFVDDDPKLFLALIKASVVVDWYSSHGEALFDQNIRSLLAKNRINEEMSRTIRDAPEHFKHFNNGVSAICDKLEVDRSSREVKVKGFSVVNGAQTVGTIHSERWNDRLSKVKVLLRITEIDGDKSIGPKITKSNNSQNAVLGPDFCSNDKIQQWLEARFNSQSPTEHFPDFVYRRKRPYRKTNKLTTLSIRDFGTVRRSMLFGSYEHMNYPSKIWQRKSEGGVYEDVFPDEAGFLSEEEFQYFLFVYCSHLRTKDYLAAYTNELDEDYRYLKSMHLFAIPAIGHYWCLAKSDVSEKEQTEVLAGKAKYSEFIDEFLQCFVAALKRIYDKRVLAEDMSERMTHTAFKKSRVAEQEIIDAVEEFYGFSESFSATHRNPKSTS